MLPPGWPVLDCWVLQHSTKGEWKALWTAQRRLQFCRPEWLPKFYAGISMVHAAAWHWETDELKLQGAAETSMPDCRCTPGSESVPDSAHNACNPHQGCHFQVLQLVDAHMSASIQDWSRVIPAQVLTRSVLLQVDGSAQDWPIRQAAQPTLHAKTASPPRTVALGTQCRLTVIQALRPVSRPVHPAHDTQAAVEHR